MKPLRNARPVGLSILALVAGFAFLAAAQDPPTNTPAETPKAAVAEAPAGGTNSTVGAAEKPAKVAADGTNQPSDKALSGTNSPSAKPGNESTNASDEIQLSLQGANVDMVAQWLAQNTGKAVIKHPRVQCQITITSSKKLTKREAINLVYRALSLEGFTATETASSIILTPEGQEPKMSPSSSIPPERTSPRGGRGWSKSFL